MSKPKNKKNKINLSSAEFAQRVVMVKLTILWSRIVRNGVCMEYINSFFFFRILQFLSLFQFVCYSYPFTHILQSINMFLKVFFMKSNFAFSPYSIVEVLLLTKV